MNKRVVKLMFLTLTILFLSGCWDRWELEEQAYVTAIGLDVTEDPNYNIYTYQIVIPGKLVGGGGGGGGGGKEKSFFSESIRARTSMSGKDALQASISRKLTLLQCRAIFVSEKAARRGLLPVIRVATRDPELRSTLFLAVVPGEAKNFLENLEPKLQPTITRYYEELVFANEYTGYKTESTIQTVLEGLQSGGQDAVVTLAAARDTASLDKNVVNATAGELPRTTEEKASYIGAAVFKEDKMIGKLGKLETEALNMLSGDWYSGPYSVQDPTDPKSLLGLVIKQRVKPKVTVDVNSDPVKIDVKMYFIANLISQFGSTDYTEEENRLKLEQALNQDIQDRSRKLIDKAQHEYGTDMFRWGNSAAKKHFLTWQQWEEFNWLSKFPEAEVTVSSEVSVVLFGSQRRPIQSHPE